MTSHGHPRDRHDEQFETLLAMIEALAARVAALEECCAKIQEEVGDAIDIASSASDSVNDINDQVRLSMLRSIGNSPDIPF